MPSGKSLRRKLKNKIITRFGIDTVIKRPLPGQVLDGYGEPTTTPWPMDTIPIRLVVDTDRRQEDDTDIGGLPDKKRDHFYFFVAGDEDGVVDIQIGDEIVYPVGSVNQWMVDRLEPNVFKGVTVILECRAFRDARY